ncbi:PhzF family phenazine biosynthesis protein [Sagittula sp. SSi028]|uniref:PhzF family phenazine biosynthesis protein n=1 Tax=Sagittula sp. SSi028 TaxID=3400636 RepID=UPI003AF76653
MKRAMTRTGASLPETPLPFATCDVFTTQAYAGNPLAIVERADALSDQQMQTIAREFNLSETIFVQRPDDPAHTAKVRIFFPTAEIPFAGHPTIGCAIHLALKSAPSGDFQTETTLEEQAGLVPVRVWRTGNQLRARFTAPVVPHAVPDVTVPDVAVQAAAVGLHVKDIGFGAHEAGIWQGGPRFLYLPVRDLDALGRATPHEPAWSQLMDAAQVDSAYLYTTGDDCDVRARMFSPTAGIPEDPATGSASAILAAQLLSVGVLPDGDSALSLRQGVEMGRPSDLDLGITVAQGKLTQVTLAGSAVPISTGHIRPPAP